MNELQALLKIIRENDGSIPAHERERAKELADRISEQSANGMPWQSVNFEGVE